MAKGAIGRQIGGSHYKDLAIQPVQITHVFGHSLWPHGIKYVRSKDNLEEDVQKMHHFMLQEQEMVESDAAMHQGRRASQTQAKKLGIYLSQFPYLNQANAFEFFLAWHERRYDQATDWFNKGVLNVEYNEGV